MISRLSANKIWEQHLKISEEHVTTTTARRQVYKSETTPQRFPKNPFFKCLRTKYEAQERKRSRTKQANSMLTPSILGRRPQWGLGSQPITVKIPRAQQWTPYSIGGHRRMRQKADRTQILLFLVASKGQEGCLYFNRIFSFRENRTAKVQ